MGEEQIQILSFQMTAYLREVATYCCATLIRGAGNQTFEGSDFEA